MNRSKLAALVLVALLSVLGGSALGRYQVTTCFQDEVVVTHAIDTSGLWVEGESEFTGGCYSVDASSPDVQCHWCIRQYTDHTEDNSTWVASSGVDGTPRVNPLWGEIAVDCDDADTTPISQYSMEGGSSVVNWRYRLTIYRGRCGRDENDDPKAPTGVTPQYNQAVEHLGP
jgi:hypothetical protein